MKKMLMTILIGALFSTQAAAADFIPTQLSLIHNEVLGYEFDGSPLDIPVIVNGSPAGIVFAVFTKDRAEDVELTTNGFLGWHTVNKVDTCLYYSDLYSAQPGEVTLTWDGKDQDGGIVPAGNYTYYLWAFDNQGRKQMVTEHLPVNFRFSRESTIQEIDENGLPLVNPVISTLQSGKISQWSIGGDPTDESLVVSSILDLEDSWQMIGNPLMVPDDHNFYYIRVSNTGAKMGSLQKVKFVAGGTAEIEEDWGETAPYAYIFATSGGNESSIATDGDYLFTTDSGVTSSNDPDADFYIYDRDGYLVEEIDISRWWSSVDDFQMDAQMNGGPEMMVSRGHNVFLNSHSSCLNQMVDPRRYLDSGDIDDFLVWGNGNGDYTLDKNWEATANKKWVCNDYNVGPYKWSISADSEMFSAVNSYDIGTTSFGLFAPDGTGLGFYSYAGETAWLKYASIFVDSGTPYDGMYCDYDTGTHSSGTPSQPHDLAYIAHDVVKGVITAGGGSGNVRFVKLTYPSGNEVFQRGEHKTICWDAYNVEYVDIHVSYNGGVDWTLIQKSAPAEKGYYHNWEIPGKFSDNCLIRVQDTRNSSNFSVNSTTFTITPGNLEITSPKGYERLGAGTEHEITWLAGDVDNVNLYLSMDDGKNWAVIAENLDATTGSYLLHVPDIESEVCRIKLVHAGESTEYYMSAPFTISSTYIRLTEPNSENVLESGTTVSIVWDSQNVDTVHIIASFEDSHNWAIASSIDASLGSYDWTIPHIQTTKCCIGIYSADDFNLYADSGWLTILGDNNQNPETDAPLLWEYAHYNNNGDYNGNTFSVTFSGPLVGPDGTIYVGSETSGTFRAIKPDGTLKWDFPTDSPVFAPAVMDREGYIYFGDAGNHFYKLDASGIEQWRLEMNHYYSAPAITPDNKIIVGDIQGSLFSLNPDGTTYWEIENDRFIFSSAAVGPDGIIYVGCGDGFLYAINYNGQIKWQYNAGEIAQSSPAIGSDGTIYVTSKSKVLHAVNPDGTQKWTYETGVAWDSSPVIAADGTIYLGSDDEEKAHFYMHAINSDGTRKWIFETSSVMKGSPAIGSDGTIYFGNEDHYIYAVNPNGSLKWSHLGYAGTNSSPAINDDGVLYFGAGALFAFQTESMGYQKDSPWPCFLFNNTRSSSKIPIELPDLHTASGRLIDRHKNPLSNVRLSVSGLTTVTDENGLFSFSLLDGDYTLMIDIDDDQIPNEITFTVAGEDMQILMPDYELYAVTGQIFMNGLPVNDLVVTMNGITVETDENGCYSIEEIAGTYTIEYELSDTYFPRVHQVEIVDAPVEMPPVSLNKVLWQHDFTSALAGAPTIAPDGSVYCVRRGEIRTVEALDELGETRWTHELEQGTCNGLTTGPDGTVYIPTWLGIRALDKNGGMIWDVEIDELGVDQAPTIAGDGSLCFGSFTSLYAVDSGGSLRWHYPFGDGIGSPPLFNQSGSVFCSCDDGSIYALDSTGGLEWHYEAAAPFASPLSIGPDGTVYAGCDDYALHAIKPDGSRDWRYVTDGPIRSKITLLENGTILFVNASDTMYALDSGGALLWRYSGIQAPAGVAASSTGELLYAVSCENELCAIDSDGFMIWRHQFEDMLIETLTMHNDGTLYVSVKNESGELGGLIAISTGGQGGDIDDSQGTVLVQADEIPQEASLSPNFPNPFNPATTIPFRLEKASQVRLSVYTITGSRVATLVDSEMPAGHHSVQWDAAEVASGIYICRLEADGLTATRKMMLMK